MKKGKSKAKGGSFERSTCKGLSLWLTQGKDEDVFWRAAMSGGRATVGKKSGKNLAKQAGDISAVSEIGHKLTNQFYIECKYYKTLNLDKIAAMEESGNLVKFWKIAQTEAKSYSKIPMLIAKQNRVETILCTNFDGYEILELDTVSTVHADYLDMFIVRFKDFLDFIDPELVIR